MQVEEKHATLSSRRSAAKPKQVARTLAHEDETRRSNRLSIGAGIQSDKTCGCLARAQANCDWKVAVLAVNIRERMP